MFGSECTQEKLFKQAITPIVQEVLDGFNCTIFAYGQTGTGKTFTMEVRQQAADERAAGSCASADGVLGGQQPLCTWAALTLRTPRISSHRVAPA